MKRKLTAMLAAHGLTLKSRRFGVYGDWVVVDNDDNETYFTTLGRVMAFAVSLCKGGLTTQQS